VQALEVAALMFLRGGEALEEFDLLSECGSMNLKLRHDFVNRQQTPGKKNAESVTERKAEKVAVDSNKLLDDALKDHSLNHAKQIVVSKCQLNIENEELKRQEVRLEIIDLEQCQDSGLPSVESFHFSSASLVRMARHPETLVKSELCGTETSVKMSFDFRTEVMSDLPNGSDFSTVEPVLEKGSMEAEGSEKKTENDGVENEDLLPLDSVSELPTENDSSMLLVDMCRVDPALEKASLDGKSLPKKTEDDTNSSVETEDVLPIKSVSDLPNKNNSSTVPIEPDSCLMEPMLEKVSVEARSLPEETADDAVESGTGLQSEVILEKVAIGGKELLMQRSPHRATIFTCQYNHWISLSQEVIYSELWKMSHSGLSRMFFNDIPFTKNLQFPKSGDDGWILPWLMQTKCPISLNRSGFLSMFLYVRF